MNYENKAIQNHHTYDGVVGGNFGDLMPGYVDFSTYPSLAPIPYPAPIVSTTPRVLKITNHCKTCNAPIYGYEFLLPNEEPVVKFSCKCRFK